jgi:Tol biopolymer transport system component
MRLVRRLLALSLLAAAAAAGWAWRASRPLALPSDLRGTLVFVSDRNGLDSLYVRRLPGGEARRLTFEAEPVRGPALSPDATRVAFAVGGRIGLASVDSGDVRLLTLGVDWKDASPAWLPGGRGLLVSSRRALGETADVHLLTFGSPQPAPAEVERRPLTSSPGFDETSPLVSRDGRAVIFLRTDSVFRLELESGRVKRLTGGFRRYRGGRLLPSGRLLALWTQDKQYGMDLMDADGGDRQTLSQGSVFYRDLAASPDGRYFAATFGFDLGFHPLEALRHQREEIHLLDAGGRKLGALERAWRSGSHSPDWGIRASGE